jgi:uncharacterized membrane protein
MLATAKHNMHATHVCTFVVCMLYTFILQNEFGNKQSMAVVLCFDVIFQLFTMILYAAIRW